MYNILLVEDYTSFRGALEETILDCLGRDNVSIYSVDNGKEALDYMIKDGKIKNSPDLVLMDITPRMNGKPEMDGKEAAEQMRAKDYKNPIIFMSEGEYPADELKKITATDVLEKVDIANSPDKLCGVLKKYLKAS